MAWRAKVGMNKKPRPDCKPEEEIRVEAGELLTFDPPQWLIDQGAVEEVPDAPAPRGRGRRASTEEES